MDTVTVLVLEFLDRDGKTKTITINSPKLGLTKDEVKDAMETIIANDVILTNKESHLINIGDFYYRSTTVTPLENPGGGE